MYLAETFVDIKTYLFALFLYCSIKPIKKIPSFRNETYCEEENMSVMPGHNFEIEERKCWYEGSITRVFSQYGPPRITLYAPQHQLPKRHEN